MGMMGTNELAREYSDFHPVGGDLFPFKLTNYAGDMTLSEIILSDITINLGIPHKLFSPK
jgi:hypothetical protein